MNKINEVVALNVYLYRCLKRLTQEELCELAGLAKNTIYNIEKGALPSLNTLQQIATALEIPISELVTETDLSNIDLDNNELDKDTKFYYEVNNSRLLRTIYTSASFYEDSISLLEFIIYLPLMDFHTLFDFICYRIGGDIIFREHYVLSILQSSIRTIPESYARYYADFTAKKIHEIQYSISKDNYSRTRLGTVEDEEEFKNTYGVSLFDCYTAYNKGISTTIKRTAAIDMFLRTFPMD